MVAAPKLELLLTNRKPATLQSGTCKAALPVEPPVRYATKENARLHYEAPCTVFRLMSDEEGAIVQTADGFASLSIQAVEAPPPRNTSV